MTYSYDGLLRLIGATESPGTTYAYAYDLAGNRTAVQINGVTTESRSYDAANQVVGWQYDAAGNLTNAGSATYSYDALNRLKQHGSTSYAYNGDGVLVAQTANSVTTRYTQDLAAPLSQILQISQGSASTHYLYGLERLAALSGSTRTWYAADALGSLRRTLTDSGVPGSVIHYDPWGLPLSGSVPTFGFTGELQDSATGLVYLRARWYHAGHGTFPTFRWRTDESWDTIPYSHHPYQYAYSNPILHTDPTGKYVPVEPAGSVRQSQSNPRDLTDWLYREMMHNLDDPRLQYVKQSNLTGDAALVVGGGVLIAGCATANPLIALAGGATIAGAVGAYVLAAKQFNDLVADHKPWDFKHKIKDRLGVGITLCSGAGCQTNVEYSVPGNIHFGFVAKEGGYLGYQVLAGAGYAEITDPAHNPQRAKEVGVEYTPYAGGFSISISSSGVDLNLGDDPVDTQAVAFGMRLHRKYGRNLTLQTFKQELANALPSFATSNPDRRPVRPDFARNWPYDVGYFDPTQ